VRPPRSHHPLGRDRRFFRVLWRSFFGLNMAFVAFLSPVSLPARNSTFQSVVSRRPRNSHAPRACKSARPLLPKGFGTPRPQGPDAAKFGFVGSDQLGLVFTCNVCETRVAKKVKRKSYETGVVLVQCPGCEKYHVIADNLGYYTYVPFNPAACLACGGLCLC
jgi:DNL zinc finger